ncbi:MAG TPA: NAD(P)-dependent alcohol dehydrogenase [Nitriliruptorales bacterium]|nr:NAD(P)-dependent alcohol dehydrogenase [Nitriliruptorales bacterium]
MKAARLHAYDQPLQIDDIPEPQISHPFDVIVRVGGAGLCRTDLHFIMGMWRDQADIDLDLPFVLGHENAGWVEAVGNGVEHVRVGDPVICHVQMTCGVCLPCRQGDDMHCGEGVFPGIDSPGGFAELLKTNARTLVGLPDGLQPADVAPHADAGLTAFHAVKKAAGLLAAGDHCVIIGIGGLGHIGLQCMKAISPATVIAVDTREETLRLAEGWGADHMVLADGGQVEAVKELTGGAGAEAVIDFVGEFGTLDYGRKLLRGHGSYFVVGYGDRIEIPAIQVIFNEISFVGNLVGTYVDLVELITLHAQGKVTLLSQQYPLDAINDAIDDLDNGRIQGRAVLVPPGAA